jgi:hypothetical protein
MSVGHSEEGAPRGRDARLVPGERRAALKARAGNPHNGDIGSVYSRAGKDCDAEPLGGEFDEGVELARLGGDPRGEAGLKARVLEHGAQAAAVDEADHRLVAQRVQGDGLAAAERMTASNAEDERLDRDDAGADLGRERLDTRPDDAGIHVADGERIEQRRVVFAREHDLDRGMLAMEVSERLCEAIVDGSRDADP